VRSGSRRQAAAVSGTLKNKSLGKKVRRIAIRQLNASTLHDMQCVTFRSDYSYLIEPNSSRPFTCTSSPFHSTPLHTPLLLLIFGYCRCCIYCWLAAVAYVERVRPSRRRLFSSDAEAVLVPVSFRRAASAASSSCGSGIVRVSKFYVGCDQRLCQSEPGAMSLRARLCWSGVGQVVSE